MPDFTVDLGGLDALGANLERAMDNIDSTTRRLHGLGVNELGPRRLDEACAEFREAWTEGLEKIRMTTEGVMAAVKASKQSYAELDQSIAASLEQMPCVGQTPPPTAHGGGEQ